VRPDYREFTLAALQWQVIAAAGRNKRIPEAIKTISVGASARNRDAPRRILNRRIILKHLM